MGLVSGDSNTTTPAVYGLNTDSGNGVTGESQLAEGVRGISHNPDNGGVVGVCDQASGVGVFGTCDDGQGGVAGTGVWGKSRGWGVLGESQDFEGVRGISHNRDHAGVVGICDEADGIGVYGFCDNGSRSLPGTGVFGESSRGEGVHGQTESRTMAGVACYALNSEGTGAGVYAESRGLGPAGFFRGDSATGVFARSETVEGVHAETNSLETAAVAGFQMNPEGTGAGVYGESRGLGPAGYFKGNVVATGDICLVNQDCAEDFDAEDADPGTVMAIGDDGTLSACRCPYDKRVAGVISGAGELKPGIILGRQQSAAGRVPVALLGRVLCKVDASSAPVEVGDLLTTSPTPGHAMKAADCSRAFGAVIGKALRPLNSGQGLIPILIALQ